MKKTLSVLLILGLAISMSACGPTAATSVTSATSVTQTTVPTEATTTMEETTAAVSVELTAAEVLAKLQEAGLPLTNIVVYDEKTDPNEKLGRPGSYTSKANFSDPAHEDNDSTAPDNTIEVFALEEDAITRAEYIESVTKGTAMEQYVYQIGVYVLRIDFDVLPSDALKYEEALIAAVG